jgi:hypothetical protein
MDGALAAHLVEYSHTTAYPKSINFDVRVRNDGRESISLDGQVGSKIPQGFYVNLNANAGQSIPNGSRLKAFDTALARASTIPLGVATGSIMPNQDPTSNPGKFAAFDNGGMPGARGLSLSTETPIALRDPARTSGPVAARVSIV